MYQVYNELGAEIYQFGVRSMTAEEADFANNYTHNYPFHVLSPLRDCLDSLRGRPVYVSIDIDVVDTRAWRDYFD